MLSALIEFLLGDELYLDWLSRGRLPSEMVNHTIIVQSMAYPPLIIDPAHRIQPWIQTDLNGQTIDFDSRSLSHSLYPLAGGVILARSQIESSDSDVHRTLVPVRLYNIHQGLSHSGQSALPVGSVEIAIGEEPLHGQSVVYRCHCDQWERERGS